jgi:hypothetical protein
VRTAWRATEVVRSIYEHHDPDLALEFVERLGLDLQDETCPVEVHSLGRALIRWKHRVHPFPQLPDPWAALRRKD